MSGYDPFTYNAKLRSFFVTGNFSSMPDHTAKVAAENPSLAKHINSVWSFMEWMRNSSPALYNAITNQKPELADPATVVTSGKLSPNGKKPAASTGVKLNGMGDYSPFALTDDQGLPPDGTSTSAGGAPVTSWGQDLISFTKAVLPSYYQAQAQRDLLNINIKRAEQGLPPIDSGAVAPQVNVGVSPGVQQLGYLAVGGLVLFGLFSAFGRRR